MYTLGIAHRQRTRTLGYLKNNWIDFEESPSMDGFFDLRFPDLGEEDFKSIVNQLKHQGVTIIGADEQLTERKIMKLTQILKEQDNTLNYDIEDDPSSQGFKSNPVKDIIIDLKMMLKEWETKKYDTAEERYQEYALDVEELVDQYESNSSQDFDDREDDDAMQSTMMDAPSLQEQKIRNKIRKEINKLLK
tara:strand:- start:783 stop:1355 length:573 start_codon:yes stop_codon:yes gene_type:complete